MLQEGDKVNDFEAVDHSGVVVRLSDMLADGPVVAYFYPVAMSPGCKIESRHFRDLKDDFQAMDAQIVGISRDSVDRQRMHHDACSLTFRLLSDPHSDVARSFGVHRIGKLPHMRVTFVVSRDSTVMRVIRSETHMRIHAEASLAALQDAETD